MTRHQLISSVNERFRMLEHGQIDLDELREFTLTQITEFCDNLEVQINLLKEGIEKMKELDNAIQAISTLK